MTALPDRPRRAVAASDLPREVLGLLDDHLATHTEALVALREDLHSHPEVSRDEHRTTRVVVDHLRAAGLAPHLLASTGAICDIGDGGPVVALRADLDALPLHDVKDVPYRSVVDGVCHACGHDVHTAALVGAAQVLALLHERGELPGRVRLLFQPAEETMPGGALDVVAAGGLGDTQEIYALHCDPRLAVGLLGVREGPLTAAGDRLEVVLAGPGGHTSRPHATADLVSALGAVISQVPLLLSRRVDPRAGLALVWGVVEAGEAHNVVPASGVVAGTVRCLDREVWDQAPDLVCSLVEEVARPYGVDVDVRYVRGVPPVVTTPAAAEVLAAAAEAALGAGSATTTEQSLGGEDFAWYLDRVPGGMARIGVRDPADAGPPGDLHRPDFDADPRSVAAAVRVLVATAVLALQRLV